MGRRTGLRSRTGTDSEERGYWLTFATDRTDGSSWFLVVPAEDPAAGPVARARVPVRVPLGLHGCWLPNEGGQSTEQGAPSSSRDDLPEARYSNPTSGNPHRRSRVMVRRRSGCERPSGKEGLDFA
ncbi:carotenoid oxygenase family protein [Streptomyces sp. NPDC055055]